MNNMLLGFESESKQYNQNTTSIISSISYDQQEIIDSILSLYCPFGIDLDPTYSKGVFYKGKQQPSIKMDLFPQVPGTIQSNCIALPLASQSISCVMFDPPFIGGTKGKGKPGIIKERFGIYKNIPALWAMYQSAISELFRVLRNDGILTFKCQDTIESGKQYLTEYKVIKDCIKKGFYPKDKFILLAKSRLTSPSQRNQQHSRKFHSCFLVFVKTKPKVDYDNERRNQ